MRRFWLAVVLGLTLACAAALAGCAPKPAPAASYLEPYKPMLKEWTPDDAAAWESLPRYAITATLDVDALTLSGRERVRLVNRESGDMTRVYFRLYPNLSQQGGSLKINSIRADGIPISYSAEAWETAILVPFEPPLKPRQVAELDIDYSLTIPQADDGYVLLGRCGDVISLPDFYPILAVHDSRGWHRELPPAYGDAGYAEAAFYQVALTMQPAWKIVSSGQIVAQTPADNGLLTTQIVAGPIREFTVVASPRFEVETTQAYGATLRSYFMPEDREAGLVALWRGASALRVYSDAYGPYPFREMNIVEAPLQYHGMEFPALSLLGVDVYRAHRDKLSYLVIHEMAHQWWYSQVGNDTFAYPWLDEGLAEYSAYTYYERAEGRKVADALRDQRWLTAYEYAVANKMDAVVQQSAPDFGSSSVYETTVYAKAALFFDALRRLVGDDMYYAILREYLRRYRFQIAAPQDLFALIQEISGSDPTPLVNEWILTAR
jgi:aminopeptidase N